MEYKTDHDCQGLGEELTAEGLHKGNFRSIELREHSVVLW